LKRKTLLFLLVVFILCAFTGNHIAAQNIPDVDLKTIVVPQIAAGWEGTPNQQGSYKWLTDFQVLGSNFSAKEGKSLLKLFKSDGSPMIADIAWSDGTKNPNATSSELTLRPHLTLGGTISACTSCGSQALQTGVMILQVPFSWSSQNYNYLDDVSVQVVYRRLDWQGNEQTSAGVAVGPLVNKFAVQAVITGNVDSGLAMYNPDSKPATLKVNLFNAQSKGDSVQPVATATVVLKAGEQKSQFFGQLFTNLTADRQGNKATDGHVEITSDVGIAVTALKCFFPANGAFVVAGIPILQVK